MCCYVIQLVDKMVNLAFKNNIRIVWKDDLDTVCSLFVFFCPKRSDLLIERASPLTSLLAISSHQLTGWMCTNVDVSMYV